MYTYVAFTYQVSLTDWLFSETIFSIYLHVYLPSGEGVEIPGEKTQTSEGSEDYRLLLHTYVL